MMKANRTDQVLEILTNRHFWSVADYLVAKGWPSCSGEWKEVVVKRVLSHVIVQKSTPSLHAITHPLKRWNIPNLSYLENANICGGRTFVDVLGLLFKSRSTHEIGHENYRECYLYASLLLTEYYNQGTHQFSLANHIDDFWQRETSARMTQELMFSNIFTILRSNKKYLDSKIGSRTHKKAFITFHRVEDFHSVVNSQLRQ